VVCRVVCGAGGCVLDWRLVLALDTELGYSGFDVPGSVVRVD
jgi:hypothetical protein